MGIIFIIKKQMILFDLFQEHVHNKQAKLSSEGQGTQKQHKWIDR